MSLVLYHPESDSLFVGNPSPSDWDQGCVEVDPAEDLRAGRLISVGLGHSQVLPSIDFETYSEAGYSIDPVDGKVRGLGAQGKGGLPVVGTPVYAEHPSTEILCMKYNLKDGRGRRFWMPGGPAPLDLLDHVRNGGHIEAHNVTFEFWIWNLIAVRKHGWPPLPLTQCHCAMAKARRHSLPGKLDELARVLAVEGKDKRGNSLLQKLSRPHTPTKNRPAHRWTPATAWEDFLALYEYNDQDVVVEDRTSARVPDLTPRERTIWETDQTINARGVQVDTAALDAALDILGQAERKYTEELRQLTGGVVGSVAEVQSFVDWVNAQGVRLENLQKEVVAGRLKKLAWALDPLKIPEGTHPVDVQQVTQWARLPNLRAVYRALEIRATLGAANVKKLRTLALQINSDGRLRDQYMFCGADRTGRWSAGGVQLQNITAKGPKVNQCESCERFFGQFPKPKCCPRCGSWLFHEYPEWTVEAVQDAIGDLLTRSLDWVEKVWGDPVAVLGGCLRGLFVAKPGHDLVCVDYSAIEAVVAACLSRCQWRIDVFAGHGKIYEQSASKITGTPMAVYEDYKAVNGTHHPDRKRIGKIAELASGYGGWINAWKAFGADMEDDEIKQAILRWREESPEIVEMWGGQFRWCGPGKWDYRPELFGLEGCAIQAILNPGQCFSHIDITYAVWGDVLYCRLPSGRFLHYHRPRLYETEDKLNRGPSWQITFEGWNSNATKGPLGWHRWDTFGGRLFENVVQGVAMDIQADGLVRCEAAGYSIVMHTHDEGTAEVPEGWGSVEEMAAIMSQRPDWASWWPIRAAGWRHKRYQKD